MPCRYVVKYARIDRVVKKRRANQTAVETFHKTDIDTSCLPAAPPVGPKLPLREGHPLDYLCCFLHFKPKDLARELSVPTTVIRDCLRTNPKSSLQRYDSANRRLIEKFGICPDSTWTEQGIPLTVVKRPFEPLWYYAWNAVSHPFSNNERVAFTIAYRALLAEAIVERYSNYRTMFLMRLGELILERFPKLEKFDTRALEEDARGRDPVLKLPLASLFSKFRLEAPDPSGTEILHAARTFHMRELEKFFGPEFPRIDVEPHLL